MTTPESFTAYSRYYDLFYQDKEYEAEAAGVVETLHSLNPKARSILELGCGTGNHAEFLSTSGFTITGLEKSPEMVSIAKLKAIERFSTVVGDISNFHLGEKFDVALSLFHVTSYLTLNRELISCFRSVSAHLESGGYFVFDTWYTPAVHYQGAETRIKRKISGDVEIIRLAEPVSNTNRNVIDVHYEILVRNRFTNQTEVIKEKHSMRHFSIPEISLLAELTGFDVINVQDLVTGQKPSEHTWATCFILKKL